MKLVGMAFHLLRYTDAQDKAFKIVFMYMLEVLLSYPFILSLCQELISKIQMVINSKISLLTHIENAY